MERKGAWQMTCNQAQVGPVFGYAKANPNVIAIRLNLTAAC